VSGGPRRADDAVLDANILIRAVLGSRVLSLLRKYADRVEFVAPETACQEARECLPEILERRKLPVTPALAALDLIEGLVQRLECEVYSQYEAVARRRIAKRDEDDWPVLAAALAFDCPIWTEDTDFFGCGAATWTTDRIELYLNAEDHKA
jgi:predicted nucleic acid-binding protein